MLVPLLLLAGCGSREGDTGAADSSSMSCGDVDGAGGDTGDVPDVLGNWTTQFGNEAWYDTCDLPGMSHDDFHWINGGAMTIDGRVPDLLYAYYGGDDSVRFWGVENGRGGIAFTGTRTMGDYDALVTFGGQLYHNAYLDRDEVRGFAVVSVDSTGDGNLDCQIEGEWLAKKSG